MSTPTFAPAVEAYAQAVRAALTGLTPEQVQDLTDGLESDLTDALADQASQAPAETAGEGAAATDEAGALTPEWITQRFGDAQAYADELRAAADLPPRATAEAPNEGPPVPRQRRTLREEWAAAGQRWGESRWWQFLNWSGRVLRPVWWALRGLVAAVLLCLILWRLGLLSPIFQVVAFTAATAASFAIARADWQAKPKAARIGLAAANTFLAFATVITTASGYLVSGLGRPADYDYGYYPEGEVVVDGSGYCDTPLCREGEPVANIYAFDAEGNPLEGVQLFDQAGRPLEIPYDTDADGTPAADSWQWWAPYQAENGDWYVATPYRTASGDPLWNAFPLAAHLWRVNDETGDWTQ
ncbi:MAG: hypothetical protein LBO20_01185, partial [Bifidobacteriaceae bacterium]|nr:hypothetical protein [Bifidobacteriaceae bacterium]